MTNEEIKELIKIFTDSALGELEVQRGENRVRMRRASTAPGDLLIPPAAPVPQQAAASPAPHSTQGIASSAGTAPSELPAPEGVLVKAPIVGTYYDAAAPGAPPFVKPGDSVEPGQVLCIIESMKLMNEIESDIAGTVASKFVENGKPVEYGEALFSILPR